MVSMTEDNTEGAVALTQAEQNIEILRMLRDLQKQSAEIATGNQELKQSITEIRNGQQNIESTLTNIGGRLTAVEEKLEVLDSVEVDLRNTSNTVEGLQRQNQLLQTRINELEDRSRRDNLIFHGIPDIQETWPQTEEKVSNLLSNWLGIQLASVDIERAHRLGKFSGSRCRPVIIKFSSFKTKEKVLQAKAKLKEHDVSVTEDFSPATREVRRKLTEFAKTMPNSPSFQLKYNKLSVNGKLYTYDPVSDKICESRLPISQSATTDTPTTVPSGQHAASSRQRDTSDT